MFESKTAESKTAESKTAESKTAESSRTEPLTDRVLTDLTPGRIATLACLLEVASAKPGNVHRGADFEDVTFIDFATSAVVLGDSIDRTAQQSVGLTTIDAVQATKSMVGKNTNLGIVLLLVPLAKCAAQVSPGGLNAESIGKLLSSLTADDCYQVYKAVLVAAPGGIGTAPAQDIHDPAPDDLVAAMRLASHRDLIARQYSNGFEQVFAEVSDFLIEGQARFADISRAIVYAHVKLMSCFPDSLIARKNGLSVAQHSQLLANQCIDALGAGEQQFWSRVSELDFWLRTDGHRRNPGTTADMIAAGLFAAIFNEHITAPDFAITRPANS